jgi:opacity protein-like surface antigen
MNKKDLNQNLVITMFSLKFLKKSTFLALASASLFLCSKAQGDEAEMSSRFSYNEDAPEKKWYGLFGTGYAYSMKANIDHPGGIWDPATEGYDSNLGGSPFFTLGFGRAFLDYLRFDTTYTFYQGFHYQKHQSGEGNTPGFTGVNRIRFFDLDHQSVLFNLSLYPEKHFYFSAIDLDISPYLGVGIGAGFSRVYNFHTVAYAREVGSTTSLGNKHTRSAFAWQASAGIRLHPTDSCFSFDIGYRYYDGGRFHSSSTIYMNTPDFQGVPSEVNPWKGKLRTNQITLSFNMDF